MQKNSRQPLSWQMIEQMFPWIPEGPILDVGAGAGHLAMRFAQYGFSVTALEKSPEDVGWVNGLSWWHEDLRSAELKTQQWAAIVALNSFPFLPQSEQQIQLERLKTALKPGGIFIFSTFTAKDPGALEMLAEDLSGTPSATGTLTFKALQIVFKDWEWLWHFEGKVLDNHPPDGHHHHHLVQIILRKPLLATSGLSDALLSMPSKTEMGISLTWKAPLQPVFEQIKHLSFVEIMSDDYLDPLWDANLLALKAHYAILLHGVELSVGTPGALDSDYLDQIRRLAQRTDCPWWSDHLCYTRTQKHHTFSLNPLPTTEEALNIVVEHAKTAQKHVGKPLLLENAAYYWQTQLPEQMPDAVFLKEIALQADCGILLDVANLYGNAHNLGIDPYAYIDALPHDRVLQIHLAGGQHIAPLILDTHDSPVEQGTWDLFNYALKRCDVRAVILERDACFDDLSDVIRDVQTAQIQWGLHL